MNQLQKVWVLNFLCSLQELSSETAAVGRAKGIPEIAAVASASRVLVRVPGFDSFSCKLDEMTDLQKQKTYTKEALVCLRVIHLSHK